MTVALVLPFLCRGRYVIINGNIVLGLESMVGMVLKFIAILTILN